MTAASRSRRLAIGSPQQFWAGLLFALIGGVALAAGLHYRLGTAARVGPGYFPLCLSLLLIGLGAVSMVRGLTVREARAIGPWPLLPLFFVLASVVAFALLIKTAGLLVAGATLLLLCCYQRVLRRPVELAVLGASLLLFTVLLFVKFLQLPINIY